jgi:hypothetical protein
LLENPLRAFLHLEVCGGDDTANVAVTIESYRLHNWQQIPSIELRT